MAIGVMITDKSFLRLNAPTIFVRGKKERQIPFIRPGCKQTSPYLSIEYWNTN